MKVLFVIPPYRTSDPLYARLYPMPLGAVYLGTVLQKAGHEVAIKDFLLPQQKSTTEQPRSFEGHSHPPYIHYGTPMQECFQWLYDHVKKYDAVGLCLGQCNLYEAGEIIGKCIKHIGKPLIIGGPFATTATEEALQRTGADIVVTGEGEGVVAEAFSKAIKGWRGVIQGKEVIMEELPIPNWNLAPPRQYPIYEGKVRGVLTVSRGCPWRCSFCSVHTIMGRNHRRQGKERIKKELKNLWNYGVRYFCFLDDNLFIHDKAIQDVLEAIDESRSEIPGFGQARFYVEEGIEVRVASIPGFIKSLVDHRFEHIAIGLETMNDKVRNKVKKPFTNEHLRDTLKRFKEAGIHPRAFYIVGFEGDTVASVCKDLYEFGKLGMSVRSNNLKLYPKTEITKSFLERGFINKNYDWRMSSWYTPHSGGLTYKQIRRIKSILRAMGMAVEEFGITPFKDEWDEIVGKFWSRKYTLSSSANHLTFTGNLYQPSSYRHLLEVLSLRFIGGGVKVEIKDKAIVTFPLAHCLDEVQEGLLKAMGREVPKRQKKGLGLT